MTAKRLASGVFHDVYIPWRTSTTIASCRKILGKTPYEANFVNVLIGKLFVSLNLNYMTRISWNGAVSKQNCCIVG